MKYQKITGRIGLAALLAWHSTYALDESIIGGVPVGASDPVVTSTVALYDGQFLCTGSLIAQDLVVTAAHCIDDTSTMQVLFRLKVKGTGPAARVLGAVVHPRYFPSAEGKDQNDIAVVRFAGKLPRGYAPARLLPASIPLQNGQTVTLAGYGITTAIPQSGSGTLRKVDVKIKDARFARTEVLLDQTSGRGACHGDSGGPAFARARGKLYLWGVTNRGYPNDAPDDCAHQAVYTDILAHKAFLNKAAQTLGFK